MKINWFPGHMKKALDQMRKELEKVDVVVYVLDARAPLSSLNPKLNDISGNLPVLYVFNKIDLADMNKINRISSRFKGDNFDYIKINSTSSNSSKEIVSKIKFLAKEKIEKFSSRGVKITVRALIVGVPNSGKSTLTNNLCKKAKAVTGDRPGVTKSKQWFNIGDCVEVCDTPGTLYPNLDDQTIAQNLAFIGSIRDTILDEEELAQNLINQLLKDYPECINERYKGFSTLEEIAKMRGFKLSKNEFDTERCASAIINDFRSGRLGRITLD